LVLVIIGVYWLFYNIVSDILEFCLIGVGQWSILQEITDLPQETNKTDVKPLTK
jgi:hypothetical protein